MKKIFWLLLAAVLTAAEFSAEVVTTIESPFGRQVVTQQITELPSPDKDGELYKQFAFQNIDTPQGRQMHGTPKDPESVFSKLFIELDENENLTELKLYDRAGKEVLSLKNTYGADGVLPQRAEMFLSESNMRAVTEYRNVRKGE